VTIGGPFWRAVIGSLPLANKSRVRSLSSLNAYLDELKSPPRDSNSQANAGACLVHKESAYKLDTAGNTSLTGNLWHCTESRYIHRVDRQPQRGEPPLKANFTCLKWRSS